MVGKTLGMKKGFFFFRYNSLDHLGALVPRSQTSLRCMKKGNYVKVQKRNTSRSRGLATQKW